jgi:predicted protein tyrosine phosphatase
MNTTNSNLTEHIFASTCPYANPYQGNKPKILFVCSAGLLRSPTGAAVAVKRGYNARSCGSHREYALIQLSANLINWAQHIVFVNQDNYNRAMAVFKNTRYEEDIKHKSVVLDIPDSYEAFHPMLEQIFNDWFDKWEYKDV